ncbi:spore germination protein [Paenibacillus sp. GP183]|uniref:spore germination protein n=1 Tax=Paenibacillus sp. GP183 TaxID=1882751 RepID=UPI000897B9A9|nr:spore germination protein [Paenibacillus sp. GP183]SEC08987.1 spore germination protein PF [Paenibacillus sp. GP183]
MPGFSGVVKIVSNVGSFIHGDTMIVSPSNSLKVHQGSGSNNVGDFPTSSNIFNITDTDDSDLFDTGSKKVVTGT